MEAGPSLSLKRRYEEVDSGSLFSTPKDSDDDISSSDSADSCDSLNPPSSTPFTPTSILRQHRPSPGGKRVRFDVVTVYYFPRRQGFTSVPSQGGSSLGMARHHSSIRHYTLGEFAREQESSHRHTLHQHLRQEKLNARKMKLTRNGTVECAQADLLTLEDVSDEDLDVDAVEVDDCFFLQPLPTKRRRALLRASGIMRIDAREKAELRAIRLSREECGCDCRLFCDPRHCGCSQAGIKCQSVVADGRSHWFWFCWRFLPVKREFFLSTVATCMLSMRDCCKVNARSPTSTERLSFVWVSYWFPAYESENFQWWTTSLLILDHLHVAGRHYAFPTSSAILCRRIACSYKSQRAPWLIRRGRRSPEATANYITEDETAHHLLFTLETGPATEAHPSGEKVPRGFYSFSFVGQRETKPIKLTGIRRLVSVQLYRSKT
ncbi:hypothetical protein AMECASPLE_001967 [Ameca splendens]|uniref:Cysteine/serine-rich nuclear protein N-terminal domain-containing protein n=2 Tax=Goodeidae TaxID=28758 RepID=A0ABV0XYA8_9TELE